MQINNNGVTNNTNANSQQKPVESSTANNTETATSTPSDNVELSREAQALKSLEAQIIASPNIDTSRVASIKQAIADGSYAISAESIANKMINSDGLF